MYQTVLLPCDGIRLSCSSCLSTGYVRFPHVPLTSRAESLIILIVFPFRFTLQAVERNHSAIGSGGDRLTCHIRDLSTGIILPAYIQDRKYALS